MTVLKNGLYHIRFVPAALHPPFVGGLYATSTDIGAPIMAEPSTPHTPPQTWEVERRDDGKYVIHQPGFKPTNIPVAPGPVLAGWSVSNPVQDFPGGNILLKTAFTEFEIEPVGTGDHVVYSIKVPNPKGPHSLGHDVEFFVTETNHTLVSQAFWSTLRIHRPHPHWQFVPVNN